MADRLLEREMRKSGGAHPVTASVKKTHKREKRDDS